MDGTGRHLLYFEQAEQGEKVILTDTHLSHTTCPKAARSGTIRRPGWNPATSRR